MAVNSKLKETIFTELFSSKPSKSEKTKIKIVEAAIKCYSSDGFERTTYDSIATKARVTRQLVQHYFRTRDEIMMFSIKYVRGLFQNIAIEWLSKESTPSKQLEAYIGATFHWVEHFKSHAVVWGLFWYYCSIDEKYRKINDELVLMGQKRLEALISEGVRQGEFKTQNPLAAAKLIQTIIGGSISTMMTEKLMFPHEEYLSQIRRTCFMIVRSDLHVDETKSLNRKETVRKHSES